MTRQVADYVIVGAGSGGCAVAYRLTEAGHSVIVIEAGGSDAGPFINMPGALSYPMNMPIYDWGFRSEPEAHLDGRRLACPRGRVLGGSSSINGMVFVRGHPEDFEAWKEMGATGWGWADVLPYYRRMETWTDRGHGGDPSWRGQDGPLHVTRGRRDSLLTQAFVAAGVEAGYGATPDYNGYRQEGFGPKDATIRSGRRWSAYKAYLRPALATSRARIVSGTARKIVIENGRATGVEVLSPRGIETIEARSEVIIAASAINTPKLLTHSGIGAAATLQKLGIDVVADRPGVGQNLQDHLEVYLQFRCPKPVSLYRYWSLWGKAWVGALWLFTKTGPGASNQFESAGFVRSRAGIPYPDVQFHFLPIAVRYDGTAAVRGHGFQIHTGPMRSPSRGDVRVVSPDPDAAPEIRFNYMSHEQDWQDFRAAIRLAREVASQPAFDGLNSGEIAPGADQSSDEAIDAFIREHAESAYHPCGTARMGAADDRMSVVDPQARVIGVEGLRVADSSIFPQITNGNLNAPSILVGERVADLILEQSLPRDGRDWWRPEDWEETQREGKAAR